MLYKNESLSESDDLETFFKKVFVKFTYVSVDPFKVSNVFGIFN